MTDRSALGDRMKRYEATFRQLLPRRTYTLLRLDGRAFHTYLRGCDRPFDETFMADMDAVAEALCKEITGTQFAYTQSDEISLLVTDFAGIGTEPWFGGVAAKVLSISAAVATAVLNERRPSTGRPLFDARAFALSDPVEVANYFVWRQRDATRNSITMTAQAHFSHKELHGFKTNEMQEMLFKLRGINWNDMPAGFKRGRLTEKEYGPRPGPGPVVLRSWWDTSPAPQFVAQSGSDLSRRIPSLPTFVAVDDD